MDAPPVQRPDRIQVFNFHGLVTCAPEMLRMFDLVQRVARTDAAVLIRGETGTGKELVARTLRCLRQRGRGPYRAINCATLTPELLASELFGHVRGAFTGAVSNRPGLFALCDRGTVFLDEIAEMPLSIQARLLRVLQEQTFVPLGGTESVTVDVRLISATNKALRDEVSAGRFREDLMYRVRVVPIFLPRLAARKGDVVALTWHFIDAFNARGLRQIDAIARDAMDAMLGYPWPGNVRELHNVLEYAYAVGDGPTLRLDELTPELRGEPPPDHDPSNITARELERRRLVDALQQAGGKKGDAARRLGVSRTTLWRKLREHGLGG